MLVWRCCSPTLVAFYPSEDAPSLAWLGAGGQGQWGEAGRMVECSAGPMQHMIPGVWGEVTAPGSCGCCSSLRDVLVCRE